MFEGGTGPEDYGGKRYCISSLGLAFEQKQ